LRPRVILGSDASAARARCEFAVPLTEDGQLPLVHPSSLFVRRALQVLRSRMKCVGAAFQFHGPADQVFRIGAAGAGFRRERIGSARASATRGHGLTLLQTRKSAATHSGSRISAAKILRARPWHCHRDERQCEQCCGGRIGHFQEMFHFLLAGLCPTKITQAHAANCALTSINSIAACCNIRVLVPRSSVNNKVLKYDCYAIVGTIVT
jgi:hypothetical protein